MDHVSLVTGSEDGESANEESQINQLLARRVDGLLVLAKHDSNFELLESVQKRGIPIVAIDYVSEDCSISTVGIDQEKGGYVLGKHLLDLGHTTISAAYGKYHATVKGGRLFGLRRALAERGLTLPDERIMFCDNADPETAYRFTREQMQRKDRPTAIIYSNDERAIVGLSALKDMNIDCPSEVSIAGYDNFPFASYLIPPLTTLTQPREELGRTAVQLLLDQIKNGIPATRVVMKLEPMLIVRKSTAPAIR